MEAAAAQVGLSLKFVSPGRANVPDRIKLFPVPPEHQEIVARYFRFAEYKAPNKKPRPGQVREHDRLRDPRQAFLHVHERREQTRSEQLDRQTHGHGGNDQQREALARLSEDDNPAQDFEAPPHVLRQEEYP